MKISTCAKFVATCVCLILVRDTTDAIEIREDWSLVTDLIHAAEVYDEREMGRVCDVFYTLQEKAIPTLAHLIKNKNSVVRWKAIDTLRRIGPKPVAEKPTIFKRLLASNQDSDPDVRASTLSCLAIWFPDQQRTHDSAVKATLDSNAVVRANAWMCRWQTKRELGAVKELVELLLNSDWMASQQALMHLGQIGELATVEITRKLHSATDDGSLVRNLHALRQLNPTVGQVEFTVRFLDHSSLRVVRESALGLAKFGSRFDEELGQLLANRDPLRQLVALECVSIMGAKACSQQKRVFDLITSTSLPIRISAISTYPKIAGFDERAKSTYQELLCSSHRDIRAAAVHGVRAWHSDAASLTLDIQRLADEDSLDFIRQSAKRTLTMIRPR